MLDVIVADDHNWIRKAVCGLLKSDPAIRLRGECGDGHEAVLLAEAVQPDIAILDLSMQTIHGFGIARRIGAVAPFTRVIVLTAHDISAVRSSVPDAALYELLEKERLADGLIPMVLAVGSSRSRRRQPRLTDAERSAALRSYHVLHTPPEPVYDEIVAVAAQRTGCAMSVVSLVDADTQWFKARFGCKETGTPRALSFCSRAIEERDRLMIVPDARLDPRFATNPLVTGSHSLRFYAGAPLVNAAGAALGTLCVLDREPRDITAAQGEMLFHLADRVMTNLELGKGRMHLPA